MDEKPFGTAINATFQEQLPAKSGKSRIKQYKISHLRADEEEARVALKTKPSEHCAGLRNPFRDGRTLTVWCCVRGELLAAYFNPSSSQVSVGWDTTV